MLTGRLLCLLLAMVFFLLAAFQAPSRVRWEWLAAACVVGAWLT